MLKGMYSFRNCTFIILFSSELLYFLHVCDSLRIGKCQLEQFWIFILLHTDAFKHSLKVPLYINNGPNWVQLSHPIIACPLICINEYIVYRRGYAVAMDKTPPQVSKVHNSRTFVSWGCECKLVEQCLTIKLLSQLTCNYSTVHVQPSIVLHIYTAQRIWQSYHQLFFFTQISMSQLWIISH